MFQSHVHVHGDAAIEKLSNVPGNNESQSTCISSNGDAALHYRVVELRWAAVLKCSEAQKLVSQP